MPEKMVRLIAPPGTDECNFGTTRYRVHDDGTVTVPEQVARDLVHGAGFARERTERASGRRRSWRGCSACRRRFARPRPSWNS